MGTLVIKGATSGQTQLDPVDGVTATIVLPSQATSSTTNTVTNKIAIKINGVTYYLLASTSGA